MVEGVWLCCVGCGFACSGGGEDIRVMFRSQEAHHGKEGGVEVTEVEVKVGEVSNVRGEEVGTGEVSWVEDGVNTCAKHEGEG